MRLEELFRATDSLFLKGDKDLEISSICTDSRSVRPGAAFFCIKGMHHDGNSFIPEAIHAGAAAIITENAAGLEEKGASVVLVRDVREALAYTCAAFYGWPAKRLTVIGVTGTKGKTTCTYVIKSILENAGRKVGLIGTNEVIIGREHFDAKNTTPDAISLHGYLKRMADEGTDAVVMEVSSQAIKQKRTDGIWFDYAIFMNLSPDHVGPGEHRDFQEYLECKRELFRHCDLGIVNGDDPYGSRITEGHTCRLESFGRGKECDIRAEDIRHVCIEGRLGIRFRVRGEMNFEVQVPMPGSFSVYNALAAISLCRHFHVRESDIQRSLLAIKVQGRTECALSRDGWRVLIDYAHNPAALASLLEALREYHPGRIICLFGCGGDRSPLRRKLMGRISAQRADLTIITDDNPRSEDPEKIREEIAEGVREEHGNYVIIPGRKEAIRHALSIARSGDLILLAGKGHETYQEIRGEKFPMDEREILRELQNEVWHTQT